MNNTTKTISMIELGVFSVTNGQKVTATRVKGRRMTPIANHGLQGVVWYGADYHTAEFRIDMKDGSDLRITLSKEALEYLLRVSK